MTALRLVHSSCPPLWKLIVLTLPHRALIGRRIVNEVSFYYVLTRRARHASLEKTTVVSKYVTTVPPAKAKKLENTKLELLLPMYVLPKRFAGFSIVVGLYVCLMDCSERYTGE